MSDNARLIERICCSFGNAVPMIYQDLLRDHVEEIRENGVLLYQASNVVERNVTLGVQRFTQEFLAVGDDGGGRLIVIRFGDPSAAPFVIDGGAIVPNRPDSLLTPLAKSWKEWAANGYPI